MLASLIRQYKEGGLLPAMILVIIDYKSLKLMKFINSMRLWVSVLDYAVDKAKIIMK
jgi:hypothetical protein